MTPFSVLAISTNGTAETSTAKTIQGHARRRTRSRPTFSITSASYGTLPQ
ncbi:hypothetical protein GCM10010116_56570 [Microbispora rosea subsp. aerata]|nr:hypothetical protein GCM10010116_56570 [Microbispora rosea subsp. aerata]GIH56204.1 hypothetical protein Mro02_31180 [Microbispora rosea subsp. aerata]GLJ85769.1 hypothetical protein GCM10017588_45020 [Microbispora rosea subsp. aerata]